MDPVTSKSLTESWNGTSWTEVADLATARQFLNGQGTLSASLASGGQSGGSSYQTATEEFTVSLANKTITAR